MYTAKCLYTFSDIFVFFMSRLRAFSFKKKKNCTEEITIFHINLLCNALTLRRTTKF